MNELVNPVAVGHQSLMRLENNLTFAKYVNREFDDKFAIANEKIGYVFNARIPVRFRGRRGDAMNPEAIREVVVPIVVNQLWGQDLNVSDQDLTMTVERFGERYVEPAAAIIANMIDGDGCDLYKDVYNLAGVAGTLPTSLGTYTDAGVALADSACPQNKMLSVVVNPRMQAAVLGFASNIFNPAKTISEQYMTGRMGEAVGFKWSMDQNIARHVVGLVASSTPVVNATAGQTGASILTSGWNATTQVLNKGDIVTFAGVNGVNPISYRDTGALRTFEITADVNADGSGLATLPISPDINIDTTSPFQTCVAAPAAAAVIKVFNVGTANFANLSGASSAQALAFHRDAFSLAIVNLETPGGMEWSEKISSPSKGYSIRLIRGYSIQDNRKLTRLDVLGGWKTTRPELACRIASN